MLEFFLVLFFVISLILGVAVWELVRSKKAHRRMAARMLTRMHRERSQIRLEAEKWEQNFIASEQGFNEMEEMYQQMLLEQYDNLAQRIEELTNLVAQLKDSNRFLAEELEYHMTTCLPDLTTIRLESLIRAELEKAIP